MMANGFTAEQMVELILEGQRELKEEIKALGIKVDSVALFGCAHREDDLQRIKNLEQWKNKGIIGIIALAIGFIIEQFIVRR